MLAWYGVLSGIGMQNAQESRDAIQNQAKAHQDKMASWQPLQRARLKSLRDIQSSHLAWQR